MGERGKPMLKFFHYCGQMRGTLNPPDYVVCFRQNYPKFWSHYVVKPQQINWPEKPHFVDVHPMRHESDSQNVDRGKFVHAEHDTSILKKKT